MGNLIEALCTSCAGISKTQVATLCNIRYADWSAEKALGEDWS